MLFYLPIYKQTKEEFNDFVMGKAQKEIDGLYHSEIGGATNTLQTQIRSRVHTQYGCSWEQNRAVGWVKVARGKDGFAFFLSKADKMSSKLPKKVFKLIEPNVVPGSWHVIDFSKCIEADDVFEKFKEVFSAFVKEGCFKNCCVDYSQIESIYKYVNWQKLIKSEL